MSAGSEARSMTYHFGALLTRKFFRGDQGIDEEFRSFDPHSWINTANGSSSAKICRGDATPY
jgi:hypothetical protein